MMSVTMIAALFVGKAGGSRLELEATGCEGIPNSRTLSRETSVGGLATRLIDREGLTV